MPHLMVEKSDKKKRVTLSNPLTVKLTAEQVAAFENYLNATRPTPSAPETLRTALEDFLVKEGFFPVQE